MVLPRLGNGPALKETFKVSRRFLKDHLLVMEV